MRPGGVLASLEGDWIDITAVELSGVGLSGRTATEDPCAGRGACKVVN